MKHHSIFLVIFVLATFLRLYNLATVPPSPSLDEVSIGYNALSILETRKDEYGEKFPLLLRAYDDWRPALYVYLVIPFVKLLGLTALAVRLPSVILSLLSIFATYFIVRKLFPAKEFHFFSGRFSLPELAAFFLAISPWHIYISRLGHEVNAGLAFMLLATALFLYKKIFTAAIFFVFSFMSYQSEKVFLPIVLATLVILFGHLYSKEKGKALLAGSLFILLLVPFLIASLSPNALIRFEATNAFKAQQERFDQSAQEIMKARERGDKLGELRNNRRVVAASIFVEGYLSHFNPQWLFANASDDAHKVPNLGLLYMWELPLIVVGLVFLYKQKAYRRGFLFLIAWFLASPIAAAFTTDAPHAMRSFTFLPAWQTFSAAGLLGVLSILTRRKMDRIFVLLFSVIVVISLGYFSKQYFITFPKTQSQSFQYALAQVVPYVLENERKYDKIVFSNTDNLYQSYMFFLYGSRYNPRVYQELGGTKSGGYSETHAFEKYEFRPIIWEKEKKIGKVLYIGNPDDFPSSITPLATSSYLDGMLGIKVVEGRL